MSASIPTQDSDWLREQWQRQRLFDAAGIGSWVRSEDGRLIIWSPGLKRLFGFPLDSEPSMDDVLGRLAPEFRAQLAEAVRRARETGEVFSAEYLVRRPDGTERWVEGTAQWIRGTDGEPQYVQGVAKDITSRKHQEQSRLVSERRFRALVESSSDVLYLMNADFTVLQQLIGREVLAETESPMRDWLEAYVPEEDRALVMATVAAAVRDVKRIDVEHRVIRSDGSIGWINTRAVPIVLPDGRIAEWVGMATDITNSKRLRLELDAHKSRLEELIAARTQSLYEASRANELLASRLEMACRAARIGTWYASYRHDAMSWDDRMYELFGLERVGGVTCPSLSAWFRRIHADDRRLLFEDAGRGRRMRAPTDVDCRIQLPDGRTRTLRVTSIVECDALGEPTRVVGACQDVTTDRQAALDLQQAKGAAEAGNLAKSKFIAAASHDLRQPLAAMNLYLDILKDAVPQGMPRSIVDRVLSSTQALGAMLDGLLDVARLDSRAMHVRLTLLPLWQLEQWLLEEFAEQFRMRGLQLRLRLPRSNLLLRTDETFIKGILRNLLVNALKYTERGGVLVALRRHRSKLVFQVWDTGIGIHADHLPHVFDEFYQVGNEVRDSTKGVGLGLSIVSREAVLLGGSVVCRSRLGRGTVFDLVLPGDQLLDADVIGFKPGDGPAEFQRSWVADCLVFLIEDSAPVCEALSLLLRGWGMRVLSFADAASALASPRLPEAEFVITDFRLPGALTGIDFLQELRRRQIRPMRSILLTGEIDLPEATEPSGWPWPILRKPCDQRSLWKALTG